MAATTADLQATNAAPLSDSLSAREELATTTPVAGTTHLGTATATTVPAVTREKETTLPPAATTTVTTTAPAVTKESEQHLLPQLPEL